MGHRSFEVVTVGRAMLVVAGLTATIAGVTEAAHPGTPMIAGPVRIEGFEASSALPVITFTGTEITYQGQLVATTESVIGEHGTPDGAIDALFERLDASARKVILSDPEPPVVEGAPPGRQVILQIDGTAPRLGHWLTRIVRTANKAGYQVLLRVPGYPP
jgi:hypothetical protein